MTDKIEVKQAPEKKSPVAKVEVKRPAAKKAPARKPRVKKVVPEKTVFGKLENSVIAAPFKVANKTFMASLGLISYVQKGFDRKLNEFEKTFQKYAKEGEKVFGKLEGKVENIRDDVAFIFCTGFTV